MKKVPSQQPPADFGNPRRMSSQGKLENDSASSDQPRAGGARGKLLLAHRDCGRLDSHRDEGAFLRKFSTPRKQRRSSHFVKLAEGMNSKPASAELDNQLLPLLQTSFHLLCHFEVSLG
jgi:hypothetical protein